MSSEPAVLDWLSEADPSTAYLARRDLLGEDDPGLRAQVSTAGIAAAVLNARRPDGHWGRGFYQPKWTSTHYSLLELASIGVRPDEPRAVESAVIVLETQKGPDGGLNPSGTVAQSDACINALALAYCCYFSAAKGLLDSVVDFLLDQRMPDGGFNCRRNRSGATHSSVHSTTSAIDGFTAYLEGGYTHRAAEIAAARDDAVEFLLAHRLYRSCTTGEPIRPEFTRLHWPTRWYFDVLRGLDVVTAAGVTDDPRLDDALAVVTRKRRPDGRWVAAAQYPGETHVRYSPAREPSPWLTLVALRALRRVAA